MGLLISACINTEPEGIAWQPEIAIPLANTVFTVQDVVDEADEDGITEVDGDRVVHLIYEGKIASFPIGQEIILPDIVFPVAAGGGHFPKDIQGVGKVEALHFKPGGKLVLNLESPESGKIDVEVSIPGLRKAGVAYSLSTSFLSPNSPLEVVIDLEGYQWEAADAGFAFSIESEFFDTNDPVAVLGTLSLLGSEFSYVEGRFDPVLLQTREDTLEIDLFKSQASGVLTFEEFSLELSISNSIGIPIVGKTLLLEASTNRAGVLPIEAGDLPTGLNLAYPALNEVGSAKTTLVALNEDNANLAEVISSGPREIRYQVQGETQVMTEAGFLTDSSTIGIDLRVDLPLHLRAENVILTDTLPFSLSEVADIELIEAATFRIQTINGFPLELGMQLIFLDQNDQALDSLFSSTSQLLNPAPVDAGGRVTEAMELITEAELSAEKIDMLPLTRRVVIRFSAQSVEEGQVPVRIFEDYTLALNIGLRASITP